MFSVYLVCSEINGQKLHKIGYTRRDPKIRLKEFKTGNASEMWIVESFKSEWGTKIEAGLHRIFKPKKIDGEWFDLDEEDVKSFSHHCEKIHQNLTLISKENTYYIDKGDF